MTKEQEELVEKMAEAQFHWWTNPLVGEAVKVHERKQLNKALFVVLDNIGAVAKPCPDCFEGGVDMYGKICKNCHGTGFVRRDGV